METGYCDLPPRQSLFDVFEHDERSRCSASRLLEQRRKHALVVATGWTKSKNAKEASERNAWRRERLIQRRKAG